MHDQISSPLDSIAASLPQLMQIQALLLIVVVGIGGVWFIFNGDSDEDALLRLIAKIVPIGGVTMLGGYMALLLRPESAGELPPAEPGVFDWIGEHWMMILGVLIALAIAGFSTYRIVTARQLLNQVRLDVRALLAKIELADVTEARWKDAQLQGNVQAAQQLASMPGLRKELLTMLAQVHAGAPLQPKQRGRAEEVECALNKDVHKQTA